MLACVRVSMHDYLFASVQCILYILYRVGITVKCVSAGEAHGGGAVCVCVCVCGGVEVV